MSPGRSPAMVRITEPFHGAALNHRHGEAVEDGLRIAVRGTARLRDRVYVNGEPARRAGTAFHAQVVLRDRETDIVATASGSRGDAEHRVRVVWDRHSRPRYRFSLDDNSFFLRDIADKRPASLFDCLTSGPPRSSTASTSPACATSTSATGRSSRATSIGRRATTSRCPTSPTAIAASGATARTGCGWPSTPGPTSPTAPTSTPPRASSWPTSARCGRRSVASPARRPTRRRR